ncbi:Uncharacterised protein g1266 [Pycnogonum litorale]
MFKIFALLVLAGCALAMYPPASWHPKTAPKLTVLKARHEDESPKPFEFSYDIKDGYGNQQARSETGDAHGNVQGSYEIASIDGLRRLVHYWATRDGGVRFKIQTNEPGTANQNPADVEMIAEEPPTIHVHKVADKPRYKTIKVPIHGATGYGKPWA